jgi:hypothetical protein
MELTLTPALTSMQVLAVTKDAVYLRLPKELQRECEGGCSCDPCKAGKSNGTWDTLVVPTHPTKYRNDHSYIVHMPLESVRGFRAYMKKKGKLVW